jgi:hypothetical protein
VAFVAAPIRPVVAPATAVASSAQPTTRSAAIFFKTFPLY